jgi:hypothetical protein
LENFIEIELDIESKLIHKIDEDDEDNFDEASVDEIRSLNGIIESYKKGNSEITCHTAINLINRYCTSLEHNICGVLYPIYSIETEKTEMAKLFNCSVRLPPNSVLNTTIKVPFK